MPLYSGLYTQILKKSYSGFLNLAAQTFFLPTEPLWMPESADIGMALHPLKAKGAVLPLTS